MGWIAIDIFMELEMCVFFELFGEWTMLISSLSLFCRDAPTQFQFLCPYFLCICFEKPKAILKAPPTKRIYRKKSDKPH